ncbi:MAG TPA: 3-hydroxyisobutyryl-CoA hydrolase [Devosia sp.]
MSAQIGTGIEGRLGVITLNRPEAINAISLPMIEAIRGVLQLWQGDDKVRAVLFEGRGERGFCSGGDVRAVRDAVLRGDRPAAEAFFATEYAMNGEIARFPKPVIAVADGVVMGGGIGIAGHARFRFTTPNARFAMPEAALGFVCDVGVNAILRKAPLHRALLFELSGQAVGAADALALGLTDCAVAPERLAEVRASLVAAAAASNIEQALVGVMEAETIQAGERVLCDLADRLDEELMLDGAEEIVVAIEESGEAPEMAALLASRSPTSLEAIHRSHLAARKSGDLDAILSIDLRLARLLCGLPDFAEGVRAVLVDKDRKPRWQRAVPVAEITAAISG